LSFEFRKFVPWGCDAERKNIFFFRLLAGAGVWIKTLGGGAKLRASRKKNIFLSPI
jgi:hypothetical protein